MGEVSQLQDEDKKLRPALRFPEFIEPYTVKKMGSLGKFVGGGTPDSAIKEYWNGTIPWISSSDIEENNIRNISITRFITEVAIERSATKLVPKNSVLMVSRVGVGKFAVAPTDLCTSQDFTNFLSHENPFYLVYYFSSRKQDFLRYSQGTSIKGFSSKDIKIMKCLIPSLPEQQKIAEFLSAVDKKLDLLQKKKRGLEQYRKGVMQKIFSQQLRFKDAKGREFPEWEEKKLNEVGNIYSGLTGKSKEDFGTGKPFIQYKQIFDNSVLDIDKCGLVDISPHEKQNPAQFGDVFFTGSSETPEEIGTASVLLVEVDEIYLNSFCFGYRPKKEKLHYYFSSYLFRSETFRRKLIPLAQGSTRFNMSKKEFLKLKVDMPCIKEQAKIASFLSAIDKKITAVENQLQGTREFKKGLLQKMFV